MPKRVFYSFHYKPDNWRASQVRNAGVIEGSKSVSDNDWESITNAGDDAIKQWIAEQLDGKSCCIVLIGSATAGRKWINYEISKAWNDDKGVVGIHIHNLKDSNGYQSSKGRNPFEDITMNRDAAKMSIIVKTYDPPYSSSNLVYDYIKQNLVSWVDEAVRIRDNY